MCEHRQQLKELEQHLCWINCRRLCAHTHSSSQTLKTAACGQASFWDCMHSILFTLLSWQVNIIFQCFNNNKKSSTESIVICLIRIQATYFQLILKVLSIAKMIFVSPRLQKLNAANHTVLRSTVQEQLEKKPPVQCATF